MVRLADFELQTETGVWVAPGTGKQAPAFAYTDGADEEGRVFHAVTTATDVSDNTQALLPFVTDWPTYYHLAPGRSNAVRALDLPAGIRILELGAGCGALARHLGENHAVVHSVEGSERRAAICRARCRDLSNVTVYCADFSNLHLEPEYDVVLLNGVLEYAPSFFRGADGGDPVAGLLRLARSGLRESGVVLISIENKLGLKYWAGAPEDHTSALYEGIHGYPATTKVTTFSKAELVQVVRQAGFPSVSVFHCFPDYKFASTVLADPLPPNTYLNNWLDFPAECPGLPRRYTIHEGLAAKSLYEAGLLGEFANSFLVVAGLAGAEAPFRDTLSPRWIAKRLSVRGRDKRHHKVTTLVRRDADLVVTKGPVAYGGSAAIGQPSEGAWAPGDLMLIEMSRAMLSGDPDRAVNALVDEYHGACVARFATGQRDDGNYPLLHGRCVDFLMRNIIRTPKGLEAIDLEWEYPEPVPVDFLLFRTLWNDAIGPNHAWAAKRIPDFDLYIVRIIQRIYPDYGFKRHAQNKAREEEFVGGVGAGGRTGRGYDDPAFWIAGKAFGRVLSRRIRDKVGR